MIITRIRIPCKSQADVMELVDVLDSKSCVGNHVPVRPRPSADFYKTPFLGSFYCILQANLKMLSTTAAALYLRILKYCVFKKQTWHKLSDKLQFLPDYSLQLLALFQPIFSGQLM